MKIVEIQQKMDLFNQAVQFFWKQWGNEQNYKFYQDCMIYSCQTMDELPRFYVALVNESIIGTYALLRNDMNSRQDLYPWLACLYVNPKYRGKEIGSQLLQHAIQETARKGFEKLYLNTDLEGYYERYGWAYLTVGYGVTGEPIKIYEISTK